MAEKKPRLTAVVRRGLRTLRSIASVQDFEGEFGESAETTKMQREMDRAVEWIDSLPRDRKEDAP